MVTTVLLEELTSAEALVATCVRLLHQQGVEITRPVLIVITGRCEETVRRSLRRFVLEGWMVREPRDDPHTGSRLQSRYRLLPDAPSFFDAQLLSAA